MNKAGGTNSFISSNIFTLCYPMGMLITYVPSTVYSHYEIRYYGDNDTRAPNSFVIRDYLQASNALYGVILALIFYVKTESALEEWKDVFQGMFGNRITDADLEEIRIDGESVSGNSNKTVDSNISSTSDTKVRVSLAFQNPSKRPHQSFQAEVANPLAYVKSTENL
jgi:hypothetical protein